MKRPVSLPERAAMVVAWLAVLAGAAARLWALSQRGSPWLDEASLALNVMTRAFGALARPLDWGQAAPVGFLWVERVVASHADAPIAWLRLVPFAAGVTLPLLLWHLGRRGRGTGAGAIAAVTAAGSLLALRYSTEAKPYASDAAVTAALLLVALRLREAPEEQGRWWALAAAAVLAVFVSIPSVFVIAAIVLVFASDATVRRSRHALRIGVPALAASTLLFAVFWFLAYRPSAASAHLRDYWAPVMLDLRADDRVLRVVRVLMELTWIPLRWTGSLLGAAVGTALWVAGLAIVGGRDRRHAALLAAPVVIAAVASMAGAYPLSDRLAFFAVPGVWIAQAAALIGVRNGLFASRSVVANERTAAVFVVVVSLAIGVWQFTDSDRFLQAPGSLEPTRALFEQVDVEVGVTPVYVFARSAPAWLLATHDGSWREGARLARWTALAGRVTSPGYENLSRPRAVRPGEGDSLVVRSGARTELVGLAPGVQYRVAGAPVPAEPSAGWAQEEARRLAAAAQPEVWLVASHFFAGSPRNELRPLVEAAEAAGLRVVEERRAGDDVVALRLVKAR
ncbi:MAG: glycosyltransferase family 39 protein [Gemmatimonadaceae bacterium]